MTAPREHEIRSARRERWSIAPVADASELQAMEPIVMDALRQQTPAVQNKPVERSGSNAHILELTMAKPAPPAQPSKAQASVIAALLSQRGVTKDTAQAFLNPLSFNEFKERMLPPLLTLTDLQPAVERLAKAITDGETIGLSGDYDCDGNCSLALMKRTLMALGVPEEKIKADMPNRAADGYGINRKAVNRLHKKEKVDLLITLDKGTAALEPLKLAKDLGMDVIVADHHPNDELPEGALVVNPNRPDEIHPDKALKDLAAVGVTFLLAAGLEAHFKKAEDKRVDNLKLRKLLGLVALATVGDVVNLASPINRFLAHEGLKVINEGGDPAIKHLCAAKGVGYPISSEELAFQVVPVINAPGRMGQSVAWEFLAKKDPDRTELDALNESLSIASNEKRKGEDAELTRTARAQAIKQIGDEYYFEDARIQARNRLAANPSASVLILMEESWPPTLLEKIVQRMQEEFGQPILACCNVQEGPYASLGSSQKYYQVAASSPEHVDIKAALLELAKDDSQPFHDVTGNAKMARAIIKAPLIETASERLNGMLETAVRQARDKREAAGIKDASPPPLEPPVLVLAGENWHEGVVGIVAGRIKEQFGRPAVVCALPTINADKNPIAHDKQFYKASARSIEGGVDLGAAFRKLEKGRKAVLDKGGGHVMAAGARFKPDKLADFRNRINELLRNDVHHAIESRSTQVAGIVPLESIDAELIRHMSVIGPFGQGNRKPLVVIPDVRICNVTPKSINANAKHVHFELASFKGGLPLLKASAFHMAGTDVERDIRKGENQCAQILGSLGFDQHGKPTIIVEDIYISPNKTQDRDYGGALEILGEDALRRNAFAALLPQTIDKNTFAAKVARSGGQWQGCNL